MRRMLILVLAAVLLLLDAAALHDILVREPDLRAEWAMLALSLVIFGAAGLWLRPSGGLPGASGR